MIFVPKHMYNMANAWVNVLGHYKASHVSFIWHIGHGGTIQLFLVRY